MKAAVRTRYGPPEVVRVAEVEKPAPGDGEVLVKVHATTVNRTDCGLRAAKPFIYRFFTGLRRPRLTVLGNEFAGQVEAVGGGVTAFAVGDDVFGWSPNRFGAHAEYVTVPEHGSLATMPAEPDLRAGRSRHRGVALRPLGDQQRRGPARAGRPGLRGHRSHRLGNRPAAGEHRGQGDRGLRHRQPGAGQGPGRRPGHRLHGRGLHQGRADLRRGHRRGRQELVRPLPAAAAAARDLPLLRPGPAVPEPGPGPGHPPAAAAGGSSSRSRPSATRRRSCATSRTSWSRARSRR